MKDSGFFVDSCMMMALCCKEQGHPDQAIQLLERLMADSRCRGGNGQLSGTNSGCCTKRPARVIGRSACTKPSRPFMMFPAASKPCASNW